jgi:Rrf2 family iron-sulfur cluster assembly transcriptional regulator
MVEYLDSVSLQALVEQQRAREGSPTVLRDRRNESAAVEAARVAPKGPNSVFNIASS